MKKNKKTDSTINIDSLTDSISKEITTTSTDLNQEHLDGIRDREEINILIDRINHLQSSIGIEESLDLLEIPELIELNESLDKIISSNYKLEKFELLPKLNSLDITIASVSGLIASAIDIILVGAPKTKAQGRNKFEGSELTKFIREKTDFTNTAFHKEIEKRFKVPYDISTNKEFNLLPDNHRLKSLSHDPFFGLFFAIFDIVFESTTFIDHEGKLRILLNTGNSKRWPSTFQSVYYYIGHIVSDVSTSRGIPIPGFFLTQFFRDGKSNESIGKVAEEMYINGYDLRHSTSMSTSVFIKNFIIDSYHQLNKVTETNPVPVAIKEAKQIEEAIKLSKMLLISDGISASGNILKTFVISHGCNPTAINVATWYSLLKNSLEVGKALMRETETEQVLKNREFINKRWAELLELE